MARYVRIENNEIKYYGSLPRTWNNISSFDKMSESKLNELNWYKAELQNPTYDPITEILENGLKIKEWETDSKVILTRSTRAKTTEEMEDTRASFEKMIENNAREILYNTDWAVNEHSGLTTTVKNKYDNVRSNLSTLLGKLGNYDAVTLDEINKEINKALNYFTIRRRSFNQKMTDLKNYLDNLLSS